MKAKFFLFEGRPGQIKEMMPDGFFLCAFENFENGALTEPLEVVHISEMASTDNEGFKRWLMFMTRQALQEFLDDIHDEVTPNVVDFKLVN